MSHKALTDYFQRINQTKKEASMFTKLKQYWQDKFVFVDSTPAQKSIPELVKMHQENFEDSWAFVMNTAAWQDEYNTLHPAKDSIIGEETNGTWMEQLDKILDVMSEHYGYDIKSQVYYSVTFPLNIEGEAGYGRCLNDDVLQQLLLSYPEAYALHPSMQFLMEKR